MKKYITRNWIWIVAGVILTRKAVEYAYAERGYAALGGEWLVLPVLLVAVHFARKAVKAIYEVLVFEEGCVNDKRASKHHRRMAR